MMKLGRVIPLRPRLGISSNIGAAFFTTRATLQRVFNGRVSAVEFRGGRFLGEVSIPRPPPRVVHNTRPFSANPSTSPIRGPSPNLDFRSRSDGGFVYGKLSGIGRTTLKMDMVHFFEGCNLKPEDIKIAYDRFYGPLGMILQFSSKAAYMGAQRSINIKGRYYSMQEVDSSHWINLDSPFNGKVLLLQGIPPNALREDVERFFYGYNIDGSGIRFLTRQLQDGPVRLILVPFMSSRDAMHALRVKEQIYTSVGGIDTLADESVESAVDTKSSLQFPDLQTKKDFSIYEERDGVLESSDQQLSLHSPSTEELFTFSIETSESNQQLQYSQLDQQLKEVFLCDIYDPFANYLESMSSKCVKVFLSEEDCLYHLLKPLFCMISLPLLFGSRSRMLAVNPFLIWLHWKHEFT